MRDEKIEVGAEAERCDGDDHEIETEGDADGAAFAEGELDVAKQQGKRRAHHATGSLPPSASSMREFRLERRVARHKRDAAARAR